jgi:hypothetical protein
MGREGLMRRREFITLLGSAAAATWPIAALAQPPERMRPIGLLYTFASDDPEGQARNAALLQALQPLGWTVGCNLRIDYRWGEGDAASTRKNAAQLVTGSHPDQWRRRGAFAGGDPLCANRVCPGRRSGRRRLCR